MEAKLKTELAKPMKKFVYKPKRWKKGKHVVSRFYSGRYRLPGEPRSTTVPLGTTDKQVAEAKLKRLVDELERERAGLLAPKAIRDGLQKLFVELMAEHLAERRRIGRDEKYVAGLHLQLSTLARECGWSIVKDVTAATFLAWRQKQKKSPKTLNEYLTAASSLLSWLEPSERIPRNPLKNVEKLMNHGEPCYQRRALSVEQARELLRVAGPRRVLFATALETGLRRKELGKLEWRDVHIDDCEPFLSVRRSTTKNHKAAPTPLDAELANELRAIRPLDVAPGVKVFARLMPRMNVFRADLKAAGIEPTDAEGRHADFHALRMTFQMFLTNNGTAPRVVQELMRHSDMKLTTKNYTDTAQLPLAEAVRKLPSLLRNIQVNTLQSTPALDTEGHGASSNGTNEAVPTISEVPSQEPIVHELAAVGANGHESDESARCRVRTCCKIAFSRGRRKSPVTNTVTKMFGRVGTLRSHRRMA
jgi:integrase